MERRAVTERANGLEEWGYYEERPDGGEWRRVDHSDWYRYRGFVAPDVALSSILSVPKGTIINFLDAFDYDSRAVYYVGVAGKGDVAVGDEALKWIIGGMLAEFNARKITPTGESLERLIPARLLGEFAERIVRGSIDRTFTKAIFAELLDRKLPLGDMGETLLDEIVADPRFKAVDANEIDTVLDQLIADNAAQFEKARTEPKVIQWFVGQTMKATKGRAAAPVVIEKMQARLA